MANNFSELINLFHKSKCLTNNRTSPRQVLQFPRFISYWLDIRVTKDPPGFHIQFCPSTSFPFIEWEFISLSNSSTSIARMFFIMYQNGFTWWNFKCEALFLFSIPIRKKSTSASGLLRFSHSTILLSYKNPGINPRVFAVAFPFNLCSDCEELIFILYTWTAIKRSDKEESLLGAPSQPREMQKIHVTGWVFAFLRPVDGISFFSSQYHWMRCCENKIRKPRNQ